MLRYSDLISECRSRVREIMPWDLTQRIAENTGLLILDVREPGEFEAMHIRGSLHVPRGVLEAASEWDFEETVPELVEARDREIVVVCRSGRRSILAADTMQKMGYRDVVSLKTGLRGWNDYEEPLEDGSGSPVPEEEADRFFVPSVSPLQRGGAR